jgi:hypothetical protein
MTIMPERSARRYDGELGPCLELIRAAAFFILPQIGTRRGDDSMRQRALSRHHIEDAKRQYRARCQTAATPSRQVPIAAVRSPR